MFTLNGISPTRSSEDCILRPAGSVKGVIEMLVFRKGQEGDVERLQSKHALAIYTSRRLVRRCRAAARLRHRRSGLHLRNHMPKTHQSYAEEGQSQQGDYGTVLPDHIETCTSIEHGLGEAHKMSRW